MVKKGLIMLVWLQMAVSAKAADVKTYSLQPNTDVKGGQMCVFVQNGRAMINSIASGALLTTDVYNTTNLTGTENYVWNITTTGTSGTRFINDQNEKYLSLVNSTADLTLADNASTQWTFSKVDDAMNIGVYNSDRKLAWENASTPEYKAYQSMDSRPHTITVYKLVFTDYTRTLSSTNIGTICLPYQVNDYTGADIYQIAYKEEDAQHNPTQIYYELIDGPMEAGHPYVFVPTAASVSFPATDERVTAPVAHNGFYGTFTAITDGNVLKDNYMINGNSQFQLCGSGCTLGAYRAYLKMNEVPSQSNATAPTRRVMVIGQSSQPQFYDPAPGVMTTMQENAAPASSVNKCLRDGHIIILKQGIQYNTLGQQL